MCSILTIFFYRNPDLLEAKLVDETGKQLLKFCIATGFRNIQTLVRKLKLKNSTLPHYIEIMACPTGCLNGGAQTRSTENAPSSNSRDLSVQLESIYHDLPQVKDMNNSRLLFEQLKQDSVLFEKIMFTDYHAVEKLALGIKW